MNKKIAIVVIAHDSPTYNRLRKFQENSWVKDFEDIARVFYVYGERNSQFSEASDDRELPLNHMDYNPKLSLPALREHDGDLFCESLGGWSELLPNTLAAFNYLLDNHDFDFIIRTNLSTYWNKDQIFNLINNQNSEFVFMGPHVKSNHGIFVAGYAMILSVGTVRKIIQDFAQIDFELIDDVAISRFLIHQSIFPTHIELPWVTSRNFASLLLPSKLRRRRPLAIKSVDGLRRAVAIRCREDRRIGAYSFRVDFVHYKLIHVLLSLGKKGGEKKRRVGGQF